MSLKVYKFGGASVKDASHIYNVSNILTKDKGDQIFVIVSAIGKTTNALEIVFQKYIEEGKEGFLNGMVEILDAHLDEADKLKLDSAKLQSKLEVIINDCLVNLERAIKINKSAVYDQIVSMGELFSTNLLSAYLQSKDLRVAWVDLRKIIATDDNFQEGCVDIQQVEKNVNDHIKPLFENVDFVIGQGFIGSAPNGLTTTLGREGSDYSAALMAYGLGVDTLTIWKDVPGVLTADPRRFENVEKLDRMSYKEAIEMTYYGAQVIHPKTIRPLQNRGISLHVKSFIDPKGEGTIISQDGLLNYPPLVVIQDDMILMHISSKDFSFIAENHLSQIFSVLNANQIKLGTMRNSAISFAICVKNPGQEKLANLINDLGQNFSLDMYKNLQLITVRYFNKQLIENLTKNKVVLFDERMKYTIQLVVRPSLELIEKEG